MRHTHTHTPDVGNYTIIWYGKKNQNTHTDSQQNNVGSRCSFIQQQQRQQQLKRSKINNTACGKFERLENGLDSFSISIDLANDVK